MTLCKEQKQAKIKEVASSIKGLPENERKEIFAEAEKLVREPTTMEIKTVQARRLASLGFHKALGASEAEFVNAVPLPKEGKTGHILVVSAKYISIPTAMSLIEVDGKYGKNYLDLDYLEDIKEACAPQGMFYWRYGLDAETYRGKSPADCFKLILKANRLPGTANESIYVAAQMPGILKKIYLDCPGSRCGRDRVPCLGLYDASPRLHAGYAVDANSRYGSFSFGE